MVTPALAAVLLGVIAIAWSRGPTVVLATPTAGAAIPQGGSCPLTTAQQTNSSKAWLKMMPVFRHPRCINCHGGIPDPLASPTPAKHSGVVDLDSTDTEKTCEECHKDGWRIPGHKWTGKDDQTICSDMKTQFSSAQFIDHILRDGGGPPFIEMAFEGKRGLNEGGETIFEEELKRPLTAQPPPGTHAQLVQLARAWVAAQGGSFVGDASCGCVVPETGEIYLLEIGAKNTNGFEGIAVYDSVSMKIRIEDTTVTVFALTNSSPAAIPAKLTFPQSTVAFIPEPVGEINIVSTIGYIALDYPVDGTRTLKVDFTHSGTRNPEFEIMGPRNYRSTSGGGAYYGRPNSSQWELVAGKKVYEINYPGGFYRLTLLRAAK